MDHTRSFIQWKSQKDDIEIHQLNYEFISDYEFWLKTVRNCSHNTTVKYLSNFKKVVLSCVKKGWLIRDPFLGYKMVKKEQIKLGIDGEQWIFTQRQKTETPTRLPLLPQTLSIIRKYNDHPYCAIKGYVLPVLSNQKMYSYLKEIADVCGINNQLTFHIARHTLATTITLGNGVPIETVSEMLGYESLKQSQHYAKILDIKISNDMEKLRVVLEG